MSAQYSNLKGLGYRYTQMNRLLDEANTQLTAGAPIELEVRLGKVNISSYAASIDALQKLSTTDGTIVHAETIIDNSISIILARPGLIGQPCSSRDNCSSVIRKTYPTGAPIMLQKTELRSYHMSLQIDNSLCQAKVSCAREVVSKTLVAPNPRDIVRLRARQSRILLAEGHKWSIDVTLVRQSTFEEIQKNPDIKREFFANGANANHYEVEIELKERGAGLMITEQTIRTILTIACRIAYPHGIDVGVARNERELLMRTIARITARRATRVEDFTLKNLLNNAIMLTRSTYKQLAYPMEGYYMTDKADGERGIAVLDSRDHVAVITDTALFGSIDANDIQIIYDGEVIVRAGAGAASSSAAVAADASATVVKFYAFDCLRDNGTSLLDASFGSRFAVIQEFDSDIASPNGKSPGQLRIEIRAKEFQLLTSAKLQESITALYNKTEREYPIDGLIFTSPDAGYYETKNYKWKPMENMTIDFLCFRCPDHLYSNPPYVLPPEASSLGASAKGRSDFRIYLLFCSCSEQQRAEFCIEPLSFSKEIFAGRPELHSSAIQFACRYDPYAYILVLRTRDLEPFGGDIHGKVMELRWRNTCVQVTGVDQGESSSAAAAQSIDHWRHWDLIRERPDKTMGNNISIATITFANYINPFPLDALWQPGGGYFAKETEKSIFFASDKYRRFVLSLILYDNLHTICNARILDLGGGRAADFVRYAVSGVSLVVNFDSDAMAIAESAIRVAKQTQGRGIQNSTAAKWLQRTERARPFDAVSLRERKMSSSPGPGPGSGPIASSSSSTKPLGPVSSCMSVKCTAPAYIGRVVDVTSLSHETLRIALTDIGLSLHIFDAVVSSFSFHYFCKSRDMVEQVFTTMSEALNDEGLIIITTMSGESVFDLLRQNGGIWKRSEPGATTPKYEIRALYDISESQIHDFGQMVRVSVPFSDELYEEPLCNFTAVGNVAVEHGFTAIKIFRHDAQSILSLFAYADSKLSSELTTLDREYSGLFMTYVFKRNKVARIRSHAPKAAESKIVGSAPRGVTRITRVRKK